MFMSTDARGMTLVELVLAIALSGIMVAALMSSYANMVGRSADPMIRAQTIAIAESFLEEALQKPFLDPGPGVGVGTRCPASPGGARTNFNNVCDYNGYGPVAIVLPDGSAVAGLTGYTVSITVTDISSGDLPSITTTCALKVQVSVANPLNETTTLVGYRADYENDPACS